MSKCNAQHAMQKIKNAPEDSPVAIFLHQESGYLECFFSNSIHTQNLIEREPESLVGEFSHKDYDLQAEKLRDRLKAASLEKPAMGSVLRRSRRRTLSPAGS